MHRRVFLHRGFRLTSTVQNHQLQLIEPYEGDQEPRSPFPFTFHMAKSAENMFLSQLGSQEVVMQLHYRPKNLHTCKEFGIHVINCHLGGCTGRAKEASTSVAKRIRILCFPSLSCSNLRESLAQSVGQTFRNGARRFIDTSGREFSILLST